MATENERTSVQNGKVIVKYDGYHKGASYYWSPAYSTWFGYRGRDANIKVHLMLAQTLTAIAQNDGMHLPVVQRKAPEPTRTARPKVPKNFIPLF